MLGLLCALALSAAPADTTPVKPYTRVLVPIYLRTPVGGANGSSWTTSFSIHNNGANQVVTGWCIDTCPPVAFDPDAFLDPGETQHKLAGFILPTSGAAGPIVHLEPSDDSHIWFDLRVADVSRSDSNAGTEIPLVREKDFRIAKTQLLDVPVDPRFRLTFRLYSLYSGAADYAIRLYDETSATPLASTTVHVVAPNPRFGLQLEPGYLQMDPLSIVPAGTSLPDALRVEIEPLTANTAFWAFVSVTNNDTQQLTVVTP